MSDLELCPVCGNQMFQHYYAKSVCCTRCSFRCPSAQSLARISAAMDYARCIADLSLDTSIREDMDWLYDETRRAKQRVTEVFV